MDKLADLQTTSGSTISRMRNNYKKDSKSRKNLSYLQTRLDRLHYEWSIFEKREIELQGLRSTNPQHPYFTEDYYHQVEDVYESMKNDIEEAIVNCESHPRPPSPVAENEVKMVDRLSKVQQSSIVSINRLIKTITQEIGSQVQSKSYCQQRLDSLRSHWDIVLSTHHELVGAEASDYNPEIFYNTEDEYNEVVTRLMEVANKINAATSHNGQGTSRPNVKLPKITLPIFDGNYLKWNQFEDLFRQLIDEQPLEAAQKMFYLKANLSGEASRLVHHLEVANQNYQTAWNILQERYDNKRLIVSAFLNNILLVPSNCESAAALKRLHDTTKESLLGIANQGIDTATWDALIIHLLLQRVDKETHRLFEQSLQAQREIPKLSTFLDFVEKRFQMLETLGERNRPRTDKTSVFLSSKINAWCSLCKSQSHSLHNCERFANMTSTQKMSFIKEKHLCINCLKTGHMLRECKSRSCVKCNQRHHTMLHQSTHIKPNPGSSRSSANTAVNDQQGGSYTFLATASVLVIDRNNKPVECRAILDSGSQINFISERFIKKLGLNGQSKSIQINGIGSSKLKAQGRYNVLVKSRINNFKTAVEAFCLPQITGYHPRQSFHIESWRIPENIQLADPNFHVSKNIDLLLGAEHYPELMAVGQIQLDKGLPVLQNTLLGWVVLGKITNESHIKGIESMFCGITAVELDKQLESLWTLDDFGGTKKAHTQQEKYCENYFKETTTRDLQGKFVVQLPFIQPRRELGESKQIAVRRFFSLERKLHTKPELYQMYKAIIDEYLELGHMVEIKDSEVPRHHCYLPHHGVFKEDNSTTKLRVVFDASCKTSNGLSLNDVLLVGPTIQDDLFTILLRFRLFKYVFTADIVKMYRQFLLHRDDCFYHLIVWRDSPEGKLRTFKLITVTHGTSSASYLATKCLKQLAKEEKNNYPIGARALANDFYMDNAITGDNILETAKTKRDELRAILDKGGLPLHKWSANHPTLLEGISSRDLEQKTEFGDSEDSHIKTLGLIWYPQKDEFSIKTDIIEHKRITKRTILADISHIYDPLGLVNPVMTTAKIFLQKLWALKLHWDSSLPQGLQTRWEKFKAELPKLKNVTISRYVLSATNAIRTELHGFSDASETAYGAAVYVRTIDKHQTITVALLCAKSRVAPLRTTTLPRLELCAAVLLAELMDKLLKDLRLKIDNLYYWTDSTITLSWINSESSNYKTFVANRVATIQEISKSEDWRHVPTKANPADLVSRGMHPGDLLSSTIWFKGPEFLHQEERHWPKNTFTRATTDLEQKSVNTTLTAVVKTELLSEIDHKGSFPRLIRLVAYIRRFIQNLKQSKSKQTRLTTATLQATELYDARNFIVQEIQRSEFAEEFEELRKGKSVKSCSKLKNLAPFVDHESIIRVGGRVERANIPFDAKHQILLPSSHPIVKLLARHYHEKHMHAGPLALLAIIRQNYWPLSGDKLTQSTVYHCIRCSRAKPKLMNQVMADLLKERVRPSRPFKYSGVDFCGPVYIHHKTRGKHPTKAYIAVFICFATRAVHLELVTDLSKDAFIGGLKRLCGRRGKPVKICCDNATNFVGAKNELAELRDLFTDPRFQAALQTYCADEFIEWRFIPPRTPHFGGLWEAAVKSAKHHIRRSLATSFLTFEEMNTAIIEIEAILNSRPLTPLSSDPNDLEALTPGHFLIGTPLTAIPNPYAASTIEINRLKHWEAVKGVQSEFWKRWTLEYLQQLQTRVKWQKSRQNIERGQLVIIKEDNTTPLKWALGRVVELSAGADGRVRCVKLKTKKGIVSAAIHNLSPLPMEENAENSTALISSRIIERSEAIEITNIQPSTSRTNTLPNHVHNSPKPDIWKGRPKIYPVNPGLLKASRQHPRSQKKDDEAPVVKRPKPSNTLKGCRLLTLMIVVTTALFPCVNTLDIDRAVEITPWKLPPTAIFENIGQLAISPDYWNLVVYYRLDSYLQEASYLGEQVQQLKTLCNALTNFQGYCTITTAQFQHQLAKIQVNNELLFDTYRRPANVRTKRSPFDFIGMVANKAFGILDQDYAQSMDNRIEAVKNNEGHLMELIRNQTSIIDSTVNVIKREEEQTAIRFAAINGAIEELQEQITQSNKILADQDVVAGFNAFTSHLTIMMLEYQQIQAEIMKVMVQCRNGDISPLIITPDQLKKELNIIRENIPTSLRIPGITDNVSLLQLYALMTAQTTITDKNIIFVLKLPLVTKDHFNVLKIIPLPRTINSTSICLKPETEIFAINLQRTQYYALSYDELDNCFSTAKVSYICKQRHTIYHAGSRQLKCELELLNQASTLDSSCIMESVNPQAVWIPLKERNSWIYCLDHEYSLNVICGTSSEVLHLQGSGTLTFKQNCVISHEDQTITSHNHFSSQINNSLVPSFTINPQHIDRHLQHQRLNLSLRNEDLQRQSTIIRKIQQSIETLRSQQQLPKEISNLDIHQFSISYISLGCILITIIVLIIYIYKRSKTNRPPPQPKPRRSRFRLDRTSSC